MCCSVLQSTHTPHPPLRVNTTHAIHFNIHHITLQLAVYTYTLSPSDSTCLAVCCSVLQCVAVCCSVLQCVAMCCSVLQCVAMCCSVLQCVAVYTHTSSPSDSMPLSAVTPPVAVCCSVLQRVAVYFSVLQFVPMCCSVLQ